AYMRDGHGRFERDARTTSSDWHYTRTLSRYHRSAPPCNRVVIEHDLWRRRRHLVERDFLLVPRKPLREGLKARVELAGSGDIARGAEGRLEVVLELEHVPKIVGAGKAKSAVRSMRRIVVVNRHAERFAHLGRHFFPAQMLASDRDRLADVL